jgi:hypothetical protein
MQTLDGNSKGVSRGIEVPQERLEILAFEHPIAGPQQRSSRCMTWALSVGVE